MRQFQDLRDMPRAGQYRLVFADPAWAFSTYSAAGQAKSASQHYPVMSITEMIEAAWPVDQIAAPDCWLAMWCTWPHLMQGDHLRLVESWSDPANPWRGVTGASWAKRPRGWKGDPDKWQFGTGYIFRGASEPLLVWKRGRPDLIGTAERGLWTDPVREHSRKPDAARDQLARRFPGPRLEMFARSASPDYDAWGHDVGKLR